MYDSSTVQRYEASSKRSAMHDRPALNSFTVAAIFQHDHRRQ
jgi:hypothetical protein